MVEDHPPFLTSRHYFNRSTDIVDQSRLGALTLGVGRSNIHRGTVRPRRVYDYREFFNMAQT